MRYFAVCCNIRTVTGKKNIVNNLGFLGNLNSGKKVHPPEAVKKFGEGGGQGGGHWLDNTLAL